MSYRSATDILAEAAQRGMRKAFFVTALQLEMEAVQGHIEAMGSVVGDDGTIYECGSFSDQGNDWLVVVAETGAGTHPAQSVVSYAHRAFDDFEVQILVGVGGSRKREAPIGTVVASEHVYMPYGGKYGAQGRSARPRTFQVDTRLIGIAKKVRREKSWPDRIKDPVDYTLPAPEGYPVAIPYPPIGLVQAICSVEAVLDDPASELEALIAREFGDSYIVEMEGYGAVYAASVERTPSIVLRGVSDMTQHKSGEADAVNQPIAAAHAAAFGFEMLSHWGQIYPDPRRANGKGSDEILLSPPVEPGTPEHESERENRSDIAPAAASASPTADIVLILNEPFEKATSEWCERVESLLREITGNGDIVIVGIEPGSVRLFIADRAHDLSRVGIDALRQRLLEAMGLELIGAGDIESFGQLQRVADQLRAASGDLLSWPQTLPDGHRIMRPEAEVVRSRIVENATSVTVLLGEAGAGKSALLASVAGHFDASGWPVLAIKADALQPDIASEASLQAWLGLPQLPSAMIEQVAQFRPVLVVIDQLDALAGYLDLRTARLSVLLNLVRRLSRVENVHIVLSARTFEFNHDSRLRAINAEQVTLELPALSQVIELLETVGVKASGWPPDAQAVMRNPQALSIYLKLASRKQSTPFIDYQAMLESLWQERVLSGPSAGASAKLVTDIAEHMAEEESLWLASARFEDHRPELSALEAAGILVEAEGSIGFTHQTVFDFALARNFAREPGRLSRFVLDRQESLFLRPKLWTGLTYLRRADINAYQKEFEAIWSEPDLRRHLRFLLIDFLGQQTDPTDREALALERALSDSDERWRAFRAIVGSCGWFARFSKTFIREAMTRDAENADRMIEVLAGAWPFAAETVVDLISESWLSDSANDNRIWAVLHSLVSWTEEAANIAIQVIARTKVAPGRIDWVVSTIGAEQPDLALRLVVASLRRQTDEADRECEERSKQARPAGLTESEEIGWLMQNDPRDPLRKVISETREWDSLAALAEQSPSLLLKHLWPWLVDALQRLERISEPGRRLIGFAVDYEIDYRFTGENSHGLPEPALLGAIRIAGESIAETDPEAFRNWAAAQAEIALAPVQRLIAHVYASQPKIYAADALNFLLSDPRRFVLGTLSSMTSTTRNLIAAVSPYWSEPEVRQFEDAIAAFNPVPSESSEAGFRKRFRNAIRSVKLDLLRTLPKHSVSAAARRSIQEEERRFGPQRPELEQDEEGGWIGSPIDAAAMSKASDAALVGAFAALPDATGWDHPRQFLAGGNVQLAREFATFAAQYPARARAVLEKLTPENGTRAAAYALDAMGEKVKPELLFNLLLDVVGRGFDGDEFRSSAAHAIDKILNRKEAIPDSIVELLERWLEDPIVDDRESAEEQFDLDSDTDSQSSDQPNVPESPLWGYGGMTVLPGGDFPVLEALTRARLQRAESDQLMKRLDRYLDHSNDAKLWQPLMRFLPYIRPENEGMRTAFFAKLFARVPGLVGNRETAHFLANAHWQEPAFVNAHLDNWRDAASPTARLAYGEIVALVAIVQPALGWPTERLTAILGEPAQDLARVGLANSAVNLWNEENHRRAANQYLLSAMQAGPPAVWTSAFDLFRLVDQLSPDEQTIALLTFVADHLREAGAIDPTFLIERLQSLLPHQATLVGRLTRGLIERWRDEPRDTRLSSGMFDGELVNLAVTLHRLGPETRETGTALFELMLGMEMNSALDTLQEIDQRFRERPVVPRRRLKRRSRQAPRARRIRPTATG